MREMTDMEKEEKTAEVSEEKKETGAGTEAKEDAKAAESTGSGAGAAEPDEEKLLAMIRVYAIQTRESWRSRMNLFQLMQ